MCHHTGQDTLGRREQVDNTEVIFKSFATVAKLELGCAAWPDITLPPAFPEVSV